MASNEGQNLFTGFSTAGALLTKDWTLHDIELIKRDLSNHFNTRVGERVMRPTFGCKIWDYLMEQLTPGVRDVIAQEAVRICEEDTRVHVQNVRIFSLPNGVRVELTLNYVPFSVVDTFTVDFNNSSEF